MAVTRARAHTHTHTHTHTLTHTLHPHGPTPCCTRSCREQLARHNEARKKGIEAARMAESSATRQGWGSTSKNSGSTQSSKEQSEVSALFLTRATLVRQRRHTWSHFCDNTVTPGHTYVTMPSHLVTLMWQCHHTWSHLCDNAVTPGHTYVTTPSHLVTLTRPRFTGTQFRR